MIRNEAFGRRKFLKIAAAAAGVANLPSFAFAQGANIKIGLMLPYTGTYAKLGVAITNGFKLAVAQSGGKLGGRELEYFTVDDESDPSKATDNTNKLVIRDQVDVLVGTVHSGVVMDMARIARQTGTLLIIPYAGVGAVTGELCAPNIFRTSFTNWQASYPMGKVLADRGIRKVVTLTWKYGTGEEAIEGFKEGFTKAGGRAVKELFLPYPSVEFQPLLTEIASIKPDAVFVYFAGGGAIKLIKDWQAAGLKGKIGLYGSGFLTDGILDALGVEAEGLETTLHYGDGIETPKNKTFRLNYAKAYKVQPDVHAVQGYDAGLLLAAGLKAVKGDMSKRKELIAALENAKIDSPRGAWTMSKAHNPIQDIYLRKVVGKKNTVMGVAHKALADPARGCKMG
ncbi:MAG: ABC transporter substrate-binding protein [Betaproteobacteria bacterium]|nr:ABC transporter substrate-binding protein [Betaproteobacteria bacterium]